MTEAGSKLVGTLALRGLDEIPLTEGHAATRSRWSANAMVVSNMSVVDGFLPLELMFKAQGDALAHRLQEAAPS